MEFDNKTILIIGLILIGAIAVHIGNNNLALAIGSGLVGYLSKDANITINKHAPDEDDVIEDD